LKLSLKVKPLAVTLAIASAGVALSNMASASEPGFDDTKAQHQEPSLKHSNSEDRELNAPNIVDLDCGQSDQTLFSAAFYNDASPPSVILTRGQEQVIAFIARSGSGARYTADGIEYWEHQGQASISWFGTELECSIGK
jgi:membrane-bound inhibitor of C-type lysozyme